LSDYSDAKTLLQSFLMLMTFAPVPTQARALQVRSSRPQATSRNFSAYSLFPPIEDPGSLMPDEYGGSIERHPASQ